MAEQSGGQKRERRAIGGELIIPVAALAFTVYYFTTILDVPWSAQVSAFFIGSILILLLVIFFIRTAVELRRGEVSLYLSQIYEPVSFITRRIALAALTIGYVVFLHWGGFTLTTFVFLALAMMCLNEGRRKGLILILSATFAIGGWLLFIVAFETRFPAGPFEQFMKGLF
ncbi:MAG: hypothetical protein O7B35_08125 [Deltaproteobacteria bacterium]|nr:hypothetical protein [Deltaproteobacteria bacterium]